MVELINHLNSKNMMRYYREGFSKSNFNNVLRTLYIIIQRAITDNANLIKIDNENIVWRLDTVEVGKFPLKGIAEGGKKHIDNMLLLLEKDKIVQKYITATLENNSLLCIIRKNNN